TETRSHGVTEPGQRNPFPSRPKFLHSSVSLDAYTPTNPNCDAEFDIVPLPDTTDTLEAARRGDHAAFASLVREHQGMVFSIALHSTRDRSVAEELAQEVFLELYKTLGTLQNADHVRFWLRRVTSHRCIDAMRRRRIRPMIGLDDVPEPIAQAEPGDPIMRGRLQRLVAALPEPARMIVILRFQEDLGPADIAEVLDMPVNTVKSHLQRSLAVLRGKLEPSIREVPA
ncbi:MAG: sigma-70 family RNA polymerase sigma factor, partial [Blastocatellia bacterium]